MTDIFDDLGEDRDRLIDPARFDEVLAERDRLRRELKSAEARVDELRSALDWALAYVEELRCALYWALAYVGGVPSGDARAYRNALKLAGWAEPNIKAEMIGEFGCEEGEG